MNEILTSLGLCIARNSGDTFVRRFEQSRQIELLATSHGDVVVGVERPDFAATA